MKKTFFILLLTLLSFFGFGQPKIKELAFPNSVKIFNLYELSFQLGNYNNPYDPDVIDVYAEFIAPDDKMFKVNGFYHEGYRLYEYHGYEKAEVDSKNNGWRIRFTPNQVGTWHFKLYVIDKNGKICLHSYGSTDFVFKCNHTDTASGFITKANNKYLKREIITSGQQKSHSFFPIGPNIAWYRCKEYYNYASPYGIYEYQRRIDSIAGNANYMRIFINRPQSLSLYGMEFTQTVNGKPKVYFDNSINQKDAAELDHIIEYAAKKGITVMPCIFSYVDLKDNPKYDNQLEKYPDDWRCNPFHTILGLNSTEDFFTDKEAKRITRNLIRYIVARWGYATNIVAWELWNEVCNMDYDQNSIENYSKNVMKWHNEMADFIRSNDPFKHLISTSLGNIDTAGTLYKNVFNNLDFTIDHKYFHVQKAKSKEQPSYVLYLMSLFINELYPSKPSFIGEFGFGNLPPADYVIKDPFGIDLHNTLWSSLFSWSMGAASFWEWYALDKCGTYKNFKPMMTFCQNLPIPSDSFKPYTTGSVGKTAKNSVVFPNNLETYYMINAAEDTIYGWCQDTAFCYQSLRRLTDQIGSHKHFSDDGVVDKTGYVYTMNSNKRPRPSSKSNTITLPLSRQLYGTQFIVKWFDSETGLEMTSERTTAVVGKNKTISFEFPSSIRDLKKRRINNHLGDAVFMLYRADTTTKIGDITPSNATNNKKTIRVSRSKRQ